jgi:uncharacterized protein YbjT (DUF2867 family)
MGKSIIVTGATGTAGIEAVNQALLDKDIDKVTPLVRRPLSINHPKLNVVIHKDFMDYSSLTELFKQYDACLWCLGISQTLVSKEQYIKLTYDYTLAAAKAMLQANPNFTFVFLSGMGADSKEKSMTLFARVKGKTENALKKLPFRKLYIARPGGILPSTPRDNYHLKEKVSIRISTLMSYVLPNMSITSARLAQAMIKMVKTEPELQTFENRDLLKLTNV